MNTAELAKLTVLHDKKLALKIYLRNLCHDSEGLFTPLNLRDELFKDINFDDLIETATSRIKSHLDKLNTEFESL